jgi:transposase
MPETRFIGLDVHKAKIAVAIAEDGRNGEVLSYGSIDNTPAAIAKLLKRLGKEGAVLHLCYEAGGCGYSVYRQIIEAGHLCDVIAPSLIPRATGDRVKTDRRDAVMLAKLLRAGELTPIWVPDPIHEAMRDLIRARGAATEQRQIARQQLKAFLLRNGRVYPGIKAWGLFSIVGSATKNLSCRRTKPSCRITPTPFSMPMTGSRNAISKLPNSSRNGRCIR